MSAHIVPQIQSLLSQGQKKYKNREFESAGETYTFALEQLNGMEHNSVSKYWNTLTSLYGLMQSHLNNTEKSFEAYNKVLENDPLNVGTILRRALLWMKTGEYQKAWEGLQRAMILEPENHRIEFYIEELNEKIAELSEGDKRKYSIKQEISQIIKFPEIEDDMVLNFSGLKNIEKLSRNTSKVSKAVSIIKEPTATIEVEKEFDMNYFLAALVKEVVLTRQEIEEIEKQSQFQLEPNRLNEEVNNEIGKHSEVKISFDTLNPATQSILKSVLGFGLEELDTISRTQSGISDGGQSCKRVSVLQIKNIQGKVLGSSKSEGKDQGSNEERAGSEIEFGRIQDIEDLGKKEIPVYKNHALKRKSSLRKGASIANRPKQKSLFQRGKIDLFSVNIDGPIIRHQSSKEAQAEKIGYEERISDSQKVYINDQAQDIEESSQIRKESLGVSEDEILPPMGIGLSGLHRKSSILKSKRKYESSDPETQN